MSDLGAMVPFPHESEDTEDPDTHATLREFVDYTEYLPSDLFRSLQLIRSLDAQEADHRGHLEWLTKEFASLHAPHPTANGFGRAVSDEEMEMRLKISRSINASIRTRQESAAEATKLHENINRHFSRISAIRTKLNHITIPSRDPTPISPRKPRALEKSEDPQYRITLRLNSDHTPAPSTRGGRRRTYPATPRSRLPPAPPAGNEDDWEDIPDSVYPKPKKKKPTTGAPKRGPKPPSDPPFSGGAPARYEDGTAIPGHLLPWNRLTNEELARLRKRMKKNSGWTPSVTMIIRELESLGRGPKHKDGFSDQTEGRLGEDFLKIYGPEDGGIGDPEKIAPDDGAGVRENKGMRLNRAKKRKREEERKEKEREAEREKQEKREEMEKEMLRRAAEEEERKENERIAREAREHAAREAAAREAAAAAAIAEAVEKERLAKEAREEKLREKAAARERERAAAMILASSRKMRSASTSTVNTANTGTTTTTTTSNPNSTSIEADDVEDEEMPDADAPPPRRLGRPPKTPPTFKPGHKRAASTTTPAGAPLLDPKRSKRGITTTEAPAPRTKPTARKKGLVAGGRRGTVKKNGESATGTEAAGSEQEWVDEDEEDLNRYCLCDEVSRGTMVACENPQCPKVWFHIECVGLKEEEATTKLKWFCPICSEDMPGKRGGKRRKKV